MPEEPANVNITSALPDDIRESVAVGNIKTVGESAAFFAAMGFRQATEHANRMNIIAESAIGNITKGLTEVDPTQAASVLKTLSGNDLAQSLGQLLAALNSGQQGVKSAQTTPPVTAGQ